MSKSWTPQSRKMPAGHGHVLRASGAPGRGWWSGRCAASPARRRRRRRARPGRRRRSAAGSRSAPGRPRPAPGPPPRRPRRWSRASGFSQNTGSPASTAATISSGWASVPAAMTTPSRPARSRASGEAAGSAPRRSATLVVRSGMMSATTSESTMGRLARVSAWNSPILPSPSSPRRMVASFLPSWPPPRAGVPPGRRRPPGRHRRTWPRWRGESSPMRWGVSTTSVWSNKGWCGGGSGSNTSRPTPASRPARSAASTASRSSSPPRPQLTRTAPGRTRARNASPTRWRVWAVRGACRVTTSLAAASVPEVGGVDLGRWRAERVVGQHLHPERPGQLADPAADAAVADDADGGAVEVADRHPTPLGPAAIPDQPGQGPQPLDQVQGHREDAFGDGPGAAAGRDHDGDPAGAGRLQVDQVDPDPGAGHDP